ncbi:unnamed protein product [Penicillium salamii]|uniref:Uncharacterized protein n=1 Tax=Penicillium salamii TaxID=1612424 RepID=A0A9W4JSF2_9EURO|nr:unnamed protein product [Penicillium salamii]
MAHRFASIEGVLPAPICLICGVQIHWTDDLGIPRTIGGASELDKRKWKTIWKPEPKGPMRSAHEVENAFIERFPLLWSCLYRALIKVSETKYHLTGIGSIQHGQGPYYVVNDLTKARITGKKISKKHTHMFTQFYAAHVRKQPAVYKGKRIGFVIHAHCWTMFDRVEGLGPNNTNLAKLVRVCRNYWRASELWGETWRHQVDVGQSPFIVPAIQQAIASTQTAYDHTTSGLSILPLELRAFISDLICHVTDYTISDVQNLRNMLTAFGWELIARIRQRSGKCGLNW